MKHALIVTVTLLLCAVQGKTQSYLPLSGGTMTGNINMSSGTQVQSPYYGFIYGAAQPSTSASVAMFANSTTTTLDLVGWNNGWRFIPTNASSYKAPVLTLSQTGNLNLSGVLTTGGSVGVNVTNPAVMLHIKGLTDNAHINLESNNGAAKWQLISIQATNNFAISDVSNSSAVTSPFVINKGTPNNTMNLTNNGSVLIGQNSVVTLGAYKLEVGGAARANKVVVNTTGADFVFDSSYQLRDLTEVETFINSNKHLPDIAAAAEMQKEGLDLGENQTKLLQKIEELTLYLIEQKKQLSVQKKLIEEQSQRLKDLEKKINGK